MNTILERVCTVCKEVRETSSEQTNFKKLITRTRKAFRDHDFDIAIKTKKDKTLDPDEWYVMAYYDAESDFEMETAIEVIVHHNLQGNESFGSFQITAFLVEIFDATVHEFRHQHQSISRDYIEYVENPDYPYEDYLANQDELDAYAFSIAIELLRVMDPQRAKRNLGRIKRMSKMRSGSGYSSPVLRSYIEHFGMSEITKKLAKKRYFHLETIDTRHIFV